MEDHIRYNDSQKVETLQTLLKGWRGSDEVCIIIDRLHGIASSDGGRVSDEDEVSDFLETILEVGVYSFLQDQAYCHR